MGPSERNRLLAVWSRPSSDAEQARQDRALRMVRGALAGWGAFDDVDYQVYAKGSYKNNTNVRADSDVDVVVENHECQYYKYSGCPEPSQHPGSRYEGVWTPGKWRSEIAAALVEAFGDEADPTGRVAINVAEHEGTRVSIDVVPAFDYRRYVSTDRSRYHEGSRTFDRSGKAIDNWPMQQYENGVAKNIATGRRYKSVARILKNAENTLATRGEIEELPSYFMECLAWNVPNEVLLKGEDFGEMMRHCLVWLREHLGNSYDRETWTEPNELKYLFHNESAWSPADGQALVRAIWTFLDY